MSYYPKANSQTPLLFIHIPKAAGSSVRQWYKRAYGKYHKVMHGAVTHPVLEAANREMASFTIVRNPYDLVYSWYRYKRQMLDETRHRDPTELAAWNRGFEYWLERYVDKINLTKWGNSQFNRISPCFSQLSYITNKQGRVCVDHVLKLEQLESDWKIIKSITGTDLDLVRVNQSRVTGERESAYTARCKQLVEKYYGDDLEQFCYSF